MATQELALDKHTTILVADDDPDNRFLIQLRLEREGYTVLIASNGREALEQTRIGKPDLVLLDVMMPEMDGLEACRRIKEDEGMRDTPIIFLSALDETAVKVSGLSLGANDFISKPFKTEELLARVDVAIRLKRERDLLRETADEARANAEQAQERAMTDALTGLANRYGLQRSLTREYAETRRYQRSLACLMIDLDDFKNINDTYGHMIGDIVLKQVADILTETVRGSDMVFRCGGEEFIALLPETDINGALSLGEKIRHAASARMYGNGEQGFTLTLSVGAAELCDGESGNDMIARADLALYQAKELGRNRVASALGC